MKRIDFSGKPLTKGAALIGSRYYTGSDFYAPDVYEKTREEAPSVYYINMPRVASCDEDTGETWEHTGLGVQVAVTDSEVILEGVNFYRCQLDEERAVVPII